MSAQRAVDRRDAARGSLLGLAMGDAVGMPALLHRSVRAGWPRAQLWRVGAELDGERVSRPALPFSSDPSAPLTLSGTDDTEWASLAARIVLACGDDPTTDELFEQWCRLVVDHADELWTGVAERSSIEAARRGLRPPTTGADNPMHADDSAVARAVPVGIRWSGRPAHAAAVAARLASITNAADGIWAAQAMAAAVSVAISGGDLDDVITAACNELPDDSWTARTVTSALASTADADDPLDVVPFLHDQVANHAYSHGNIAPETLASALVLVRAARGDMRRAIPAAALIPKQSDSMPAIVGALCGALGGRSAIPSSWVPALDRVRGILLPGEAGVSLLALADALCDGDPVRSRAFP